MKQNPIVIGSSLGAVASGLAAVAGTSCCAGPAVIAFIGTGGVLMGARLEPFRLYFVLVSVALLGVGFWLAYHPKRGCIGRACTTTSAKATRAVLWIAALLTGGSLLFSKFVGG
jgi:mercuric ion transport protein